MTTGRINQVDRSEDPGGPKAAFRENVAKVTNGLQGPLLRLLGQWGQGAVRAPGPFELLSRAIFTVIPAPSCTTQIKMHRRGDSPRRRSLLQTLHAGGDTTRSLLLRVRSAYPARFYFPVSGRFECGSARSLGTLAQAAISPACYRDTKGAFVQPSAGGLGTHERALTRPRAVSPIRSP